MEPGTLLIIDDSVSVRAEVLRVLREKGDFSRFLEAENGLVGLKLLTEVGQGIDAILCDLNMPLMDGFKFLRAAKSEPNLADIPVVMLTAEAEVGDVVKAFDLGAYDYITKPFLPAILRARLSAMYRIKRLQDQLKAQKNQMEKMATTDPLTSLPNVRQFRKALEVEVSRSARYGHPLSIVMLDIDHFKRVNDTWGHPAGDAVLVGLGGLFAVALRQVDLAARYGGEEFVVILPHTTGEDARMVAERLRVAVEEKPFPGAPGGIPLTVSLGVSTREGKDGPDGQALINAADQALYQAKEGGRNRVVVAWEPAPPASAPPTRGSAG
jgi:two-component system cell cycle response regulator